MANAMQFRGPNASHGADTNSARRDDVLECVKEWRDQKEPDGRAAGVLIAKDGRQVRLLVSKWCEEFPQGYTQALEQAMKKLDNYKK